MRSDPHKPVLSILLLTADLTPGGPAAPVRLLAARLPRERFRVTVAVLGGTDERTENELQAAGVTVRPLPIRHGFDLSGNRRFQRAVRGAAPDVVHAWGPAAVGAARLALAVKTDGGHPPRFVVSGATALGGGVTGWLVARALRRADRVVSATRADGDRYRQLGVAGERLARIAPAAPTFEGRPDRESVSRRLGLPVGAQLLMNGGRTDRGTGPKDAIVAFDMLRYDNSDLRLLVCGAGAEAPALDRFGRALAFDDFRIHFAPDADRPDAVRLASAAMITRRTGGVEEALEAMAAGTPVVGWHTPDLGEVLDNGVTGLLVPVGDRAGLASKTRKLLDDPKFARTVGEAGRDWALAHFGAERMVDQYARLYDELARVPPPSR